VVLKMGCTSPVIPLSQGVQDFYNGPCAAIDIEELDYINEINEIIKLLVDKSGWGNI